MNAAPGEPAAQAERTALAWRRTALGVGTGAVVAARLAAPAAGPAAYLLVVIGGTATGLLFATARRRYRAALLALADPGADGVPGPGLPAALVAGAAALTGLAGVLFVLAR
jgi:putative membrane protein